MPRITAMPGKARWKATIDAAEALLGQAAEEMREYWEERSEAWRESYAAEEHLERSKKLGKIAEALEAMQLLW